MNMLQKLKDELLSDHPLTGPYSNDDAVAADEINAVNRTKNRATMTSSEVVNTVSASELAALNPTLETRFWRLMGMGSIDPFGAELAILTDIFPANSASIVALTGARAPAASRATELGLHGVREGTVAQARRLP